MQDIALTPELVDIGGLRTEIRLAGEGRPIVFLHPGLGIALDGAQDFVALLAKRARVIVPSHPGFGRSDLPPWVTSVDDLSYFYLDLLDALDLRDVLLVGSSLGGWVAAALAVKTTERVGRIVLLDPLGIKVGGREQRDIADIYALSEADLQRRLFHDPAMGRRAYAAMPEARLETIARNRETEALIAWSPYMHDPKLKRRLPRIRVPTLVLWGAADGIVTPDYGRAYAAAIPGAQFQVIERAGHLPHVEQPSVVVAQIAAFAEADGAMPRKSA